MSAIVDVIALSARISGKTVWTFVRARDDAGREGWGEATLPGQAAAVQAQVARLAPSVVGRAPEPSRQAPPLADITEASAHSAIDQALWDLHAQARGTSIAAALEASPHRTTIPLYANINRGTINRSPAGFAARAIEAVRLGFDAIKVAPFDDVAPEKFDRALIDAGIARVVAVREAIGSATRLMVDCHWRFTESVASEVLGELAPCALHWFECPIAETQASFPALRRLRAQANAMGVRLAGCETMIGLAAFESFLDAGAYDVIMPDVKYAGGVAEMLRIGAAAEARGVECSPHNPSGPIAHVHSVHVSAALAAVPFLEFQYGESPLFFDIVQGDMPDPNRGSSALPRAPGLGVRIDMTKVSPLLA